MAHGSVICENYKRCGKSVFPCNTYPNTKKHLISEQHVKIAQQRWPLQRTGSEI